MSLSYEKHGDLNYTFMDYRGLKGDAFVEEIKNVSATAEKNNTGKKAKVLVDVSGSIIDSTVLDTLKETTKKRHGVVEKVAVVGVTGVKKIFADVVAKFSETNMKYFETKEQALEWLEK